MLRPVDGEGHTTGIAKQADGRDWAAPSKSGRGDKIGELLDCTMQFGATERAGDLQAMTRQDDEREEGKCVRPRSREDGEKKPRQRAGREATRQTLGRKIVNNL